MLVQEKKPLIRIWSEEPPSEKIILYLKKYYDAVVVEKEEDDESISIEDWDFFTDHKVSPGKAVFIYRKNRGWSQAELARWVGLKNRQTISAIENEIRGVSKKVAINLSKVFNVPIERFI
jgi:DNA-binding XRE family transcriptional regulator